jgi:hypothetical protein
MRHCVLLEQTGEFIMTSFRTSFASAAFLLGAAATVSAQENYAAWAPLTDPFPSTVGGGIMIHDYNPIVANGLCTTNFRAIEPNGTTYRNTISFDAVEIQGGTLCSNGKWRSADGSASGTTPFRSSSRMG